MKVVVVGEVAVGPSWGPCKVLQDLCMVPLVALLHHNALGSGTDRRLDQQHTEAFVDRRKLVACERVAAVEDHTLLCSAGRKAPVEEAEAFDRSLGADHLGSADLHKDCVVGPGGVVAVDDGAVVGEPGHKVDPRFSSDQDWLKHEMTEEIERLGEAVGAEASDKQLVVGERKMEDGDLGGLADPSCCAAAVAVVGEQRWKAFDGKAAVVAAEAGERCRKAGSDSHWVLVVAPAEVLI